MTRPFQFIAGLRHVVDLATLVEHARDAEAIGYTHLCIHDYVAAQLAPIPMCSGSPTESAIEPTCAGPARRSPRAR